MSLCECTRPNKYSYSYIVVVIFGGRVRVYISTLHKFVSELITWRVITVVDLWYAKQGFVTLAYFFPQWDWEQQFSRRPIVVPQLREFCERLYYASGSLNQRRQGPVWKKNLLDFATNQCMQIYTPTEVAPSPAIVAPRVSVPTYMSYQRTSVAWRAGRPFP